MRGIYPFSQSTTTGGAGSTDTVKVTIQYQQFSIVGGMTGGAVSGSLEEGLGLSMAALGVTGLIVFREGKETPDE